MKKLISVLLALIMIFSVTTVAFAAEETDGTTPPTSDTTTEGGEGESESTEPEEEDSLLGEYDWILDLPFATVKPALKIAKIALKLYKVYLKLGFIFGWVDKEAFTQQISDFISGLIGNIQPEEAPEEAATAPAADAA